MRFAPFDLLQRVVEGHGRAKYDLSSSDMPPQRLSEFGGLEDLSLAENHPGGSPELRSILAEMYGGKSEDYLVTAGASEANFAVCAALLSPGDAILVERPVYQPLEAIPQALSGNVEHLVRREEDGFGLAEDQVREAIPKGLRLLVLSNLHNPSGAALDAKTVRGIADLAAEQGFFVLMDEIFRELAYGHEPPTIGGRNEKVIVTSSVSKYYGAGGLRIGWIRASQPVRASVRATLDYMSVSAAGPSDAIARVLLRDKEKTARRNCRLIEEGRRIAREWANETPEASFTEPVAHLAFPAITTDTAVLADRLFRDHATFIAPGESFGLGGHFRLNVGRGREQLEGGLNEVSKALH